MDVVRPVVDGDPPHAFVFFPVAGQASAVHDLPGDPHPRVIAQLGVAGRRADLAVVNRLGRRAVT
jgi:hypothetical protein